MGTAGQRCTTLRRLFVHDSVYDNLMPRLKAAAGSLKIGDPRADGVLVGPLIDEQALVAMQAALAQATAVGGTVTGGKRAGTGDGFYAAPAVVEMPEQTDVVKRETFAADSVCHEVFGPRPSDRLA